MSLQINSAACKNKGFILDGYPRSGLDAKHIFMKKIESKETNAEDSKATEEDNWEVIEDLIPQYVIAL